MKVLAIETSSSVASLALCTDKGVLAARCWDKQKSHSELITTKIDECLTEAQVKPEQLDGLAVSLGPGSFTGVRIGVTTARTIAYSLDLPIAAVPSLELLAANCHSKDSPVLAAVYAFRNLVYTCEFQWDGDLWKPQASPEAITIEQVSQKLASPKYVIGSAWPYIEQVLQPQYRSNAKRTTDEDLPRAEVLGQMVIKGAKWKKWNEIQPIYIRASEAEEKLKQGLLKPLPQL